MVITISLHLPVGFSSRQPHRLHDLFPQIGREWQHLPCSPFPQLCPHGWDLSNRIKIYDRKRPPTAYHLCGETSTQRYFAFIWFFNLCDSEWVAHTRKKPHPLVRERLFNGSFQQDFIRSLFTFAKRCNLIKKRITIHFLRCWLLRLCPVPYNTEQSAVKYIQFLLGN